MDSILTSIKKLLGITEEYTQFDQDIIIHINSAFMVLRQLGVGPEDGYSIKDKTNVWSEYLTGADAKKLESVKTYVYFKVRMMFDPPTSSIVAEAMNKTISELEWRLNVSAESAL